MIHTATWMNLRNTTLSKGSQTQQAVVCFQLLEVLEEAKPVEIAAPRLRQEVRRRLLQGAERIWGGVCESNFPYFP